MSHDVIASALLFRLAQQGTDITEPVYAVTVRDVLIAVARRHGADALTLPNTSLLVALDEVRAVFEHDRSDRELFEIALEAWEIRRKL